MLDMKAFESHLDALAQIIENTYLVNKWSWEEVGKCPTIEEIRGELSKLFNCMLAQPDNTISVESKRIKVERTILPDKVQELAFYIKIS